MWKEGYPTMDMFILAYCTSFALFVYNSRMEIAWFNADTLGFDIMFETNPSDKRGLLMFLIFYS